MKAPHIPAWEKLLAHASLLQGEIPGAVLVGGTAAALHAGHRISLDHDHVLKNLARNHDASLAALESIAGWRTRRRIRGKMILGDIEGTLAGLRNLRRTVPLETTVVMVKGHPLVLPTLDEMLRIKCFLVAERGATRDYLDVAALSHHIGLESGARALEALNELYSGFAGESGDMLTSILVRLASPAPFDLDEVNLEEYKGIVPPWNDWTAVVDQCRRLAAASFGKT